VAVPPGNETNSSGLGEVRRRVQFGKQETAPVAGRYNRYMRDSTLPPRIQPRAEARSHLIPMNEGRRVERGLLMGALVCSVLLIAGYFIFVTTAWGHQVDDDAFFGRMALSRKIIALDSGFLELVNMTSITAAAGILFLIAAARRCAFVGIIAVAGFGVAVAGAEVFKNVLPWQALVPADRVLNAGIQTSTYPSGHATVGTSFALGLLLVSSYRWRRWLTLVGGCISAAFSTGVVLAGWHRPSDPLGALAWSGLCFSIVAAVANRFQGRSIALIAHSGRTRFGGAALRILVAGTGWLTTWMATDEKRYAEPPFYLLTGLIIAGAFTLVTWYGWQLRSIDWCGER